MLNEHNNKQVQDEQLLASLLDPEAREKVKKSSRLFESINKIISSYSPKSAEFVNEESFSKSARNTILVLAILGTLGSGGCRYIRETYPRDVLSAESISQLDDGGEYLKNGIPADSNKSPLSLLIKNDYSFLAAESKSYLFALSPEEADLISETNNFQELRDILRIEDPILRVQKVIEYLQVTTKEDALGNRRYSSNLEDGTCNLYVTDILDLLYYGQNSDLLTYRTDMEGNPITDPVQILQIDNGERTDFYYNNAHALYQRSGELAAQGLMVDATEFTYNQHVEYLEDGYIFIVFLVNENDGLASHTMLEFGYRDWAGKIIPARTQATRNVLGSEVTKKSVIFNGDELEDFGKRYPKVYGIKIK